MRVFQSLKFLLVLIKKLGRHSFAGPLVPQVGGLSLCFRGHGAYAAIAVGTLRPVMDYADSSVMP